MSETEYEALAVDARSLPAILPLLAAFAETDACRWSAEALTALAWNRLADAMFHIWAVVEKGGLEPVGFLVAQLQPASTGPEMFVLAAYITPGTGAGAAVALGKVVDRWAVSFGLTEILARTKRGTENGLSEPRAWKKLGYEYDSTLLRRSLRAPLKSSGGKEEES